MKLFKIYIYFTGSMTDYVSQFKNNEALYNQARTFWSKMEGLSIILVILFLVLGGFLSYFYYSPYNKQPGRHYTPKHWLLFLAITFVLTFLVTLGCEYFAVNPRLDGALFLQTKIALGNAIYASLVYLAVSIVWCIGFPTNAYRLFKP